jgi:hypothetical protein
MKNEGFVGSIMVGLKSIFIKKNIQKIFKFQKRNKIIILNKFQKF